MKFFIFRCTVILTLGILLFEGCVPSKPLEEEENLPPERLINKLEVNRRRIKTFEGTGVLFIKSNQFDNSASFRVVLTKPDSVYLTIFGPFGIELAQALVTGKDFVFYDALENIVYKGLVSDEILRGIFKIDLSFNDLMDAFIGSVNLTQNLYRIPDSFNKNQDQYFLSYKDSVTSFSSEYKIDSKEFAIEEYKLINPRGEAVINGMYSRFEVLENVPIPSHIEVQNLKGNQKVVIDYREILINNKNTFIDFNYPDDATIIKW
ncbi:MAG: DUF4292 domain-containing protein [Ignavibacteriaceae bacterium]|nr:DUF4292 domain-containing protein [Ignavibacteriaceae bacterium]